MAQTATALAKRVDTNIFVLRGHRIILDQDLAQLYGVEVRHLNQQVKRNARRFPPEFVFRLSTKEAAFLRSQIVISNEGRGGRRYRPFAFTEHGAIMAATVLKSQRAIQMSIFVVRAFVRVRKILSANQLIIAKLSELERRIENHDSDIQQLIDAIRSLMVPAPANRRKIGFELLGNVHATSRVRIAV